jgi:hypothetical protein
MKTFNTRKSAEITSTPERAVSSRVQAHGKKGKSVDGNPFEALSDEDDEEDADMTAVQDGNLKRATHRKATEATTTEEKRGVYPLFAQTRVKVQGSNNKKKQQQEETDSSHTATTEDEEGGRSKINKSTTGVVTRARRETELTTTEQLTKKVASTRASGSKGKGPKGSETMEGDETWATVTTTESTTAGKGSLGGDMQGSKQLQLVKETDDTSGTVPHVPIRLKFPSSGHSKTSKSSVTNQSIPSQATTSSSKKATFAEQASKLPTTTNWVTADTRVSSYFLATF